MVGTAVERKRQSKARTLLLDVATSWKDSTENVSANNLRAELEGLVPVTNRGIFGSEQLFVDSRVRHTGELSVADAAECVADIPRTWRFIRDVVNATKSCLDRSDKEVLVIDAGCGPYLFLGLAALLLDPSRVRLVCSELNLGSLIAAKIISEQLGVDGRVIFVKKDARHLTEAELRLSVPGQGAQQADILISETFDSGLHRERGPAILQHLSRFISPQGYIIPRSYSIHAHAGELDRQGFQKYTKVAQFTPQGEPDGNAQKKVPIVFDSDDLISLSVGTGLQFNDPSIPPLEPPNSSPICRDWSVAYLHPLKLPPKASGKMRMPHCEVEVDLSQHFQGGDTLVSVKGREGAAVRSSLRGALQARSMQLFRG